MGRKKKPLTKYVCVNSLAIDGDTILGFVPATFYTSLETYKKKDKFISDVKRYVELEERTIDSLFDEKKNKYAADRKTYQKLLEFMLDENFTHKELYDLMRIVDVEIKDLIIVSDSLWNHLYASDKECITRLSKNECLIESDSLVGINENTQSRIYAIIEKELDKYGGIDYGRKSHVRRFKERN